MDKHVEMPFCGFEGFTILAENYLGIEDHKLFVKIEGLLEEIDVTPADVAENLIARRGKGEEDSGEECLNKLIEVLEKKVEENRVNNAELPLL